MIRPSGAVEEGTAGGTIPTTGRLVIGDVVGTAIEMCRHRTRVGVAMVAGEGTSTTEEGELNIAKIFKAFLCVCAVYSQYWYE